MMRKVTKRENKEVRVKSLRRKLGLLRPNLRFWGVKVNRIEWKPRYNIVILDNMSIEMRTPKLTSRTMSVHGIYSSLQNTEIKVYTTK